MQFYKHLEIEEKNKFQSKTTTNDKVKMIANTIELPFEWLILELCKLFHCTPSQLDNEDFNALRDLYALETAYQNYNAWSQNEKIPVRLKLSAEILKLEKDLQ